MTHHPLVSIITPCYNHEAFISDCAESVFKQTYPNIEWIVCDDASSDNSLQVLHQSISRCQSKYPDVRMRIEILHNDANLGITKTLNRMLPLTNGAYIKIMASDDVLSETYTAQVVSALESRPDYIAGACNMQYIAETDSFPVSNGGELLYNSPPPAWDTPEAFYEVYQLNTIPAPGAIVRKSAYEKYGVYDETILIEDLEYWLRLLHGGEKILYIDDALVYYRRSHLSFMSMEKNASLDLRRVRYFKAFISVIDKYGCCVPEQVYLDRRLKAIIDEYHLSYTLHLPALKAATKHAFYDKCFIRRYPMTTRAGFAFLFAHWFLKDCLKTVKRRLRHG